MSLPEFSLLCDYVASGAGYGDPLDRDPDTVARDVRVGTTSMEIAERVYGVIIDPEDYSADPGKTESLRRRLREERLKEGKPPTHAQSSPKRYREGPLKIHEYLEIAQDGRDAAIQCARCGHTFCHPGENYKKYSVRRTRSLSSIARYPLPSGEEYLGHYHEYICPECATLLQVDVFCPALDGEEDLWDIRIGLDES